MTRSILFAFLSLLLPSLSAAQQWQNIAPMHAGRIFAQYVVLADGRILMAGGEAQTQLLNECEIYDPKTDSWSLTGSLNVARSRFSMATLPNGMVIAAGGLSIWGAANTATAELYDPSTGTWTMTQSLSRSRESTNPPLILPDGTALFVGGYDGDNNGYITNIDQFDYRTETMKQFPNMLIGCWGSEYVYAPELNGILVAGGNVSTSTGENLRSTQFYSFRSGRWSFLDSLLVAINGAHQILYIPDSGIYLFSGNSSINGSTKEVQRFNCGSMRWELAGTGTSSTSFGYSFQINRDSVLTLGSDAQIFGSNPLRPAWWFNLSNCAGYPGPSPNTLRTFAGAISTRQPNVSTPCQIQNITYIFSGQDSVGALLTSCEKITFTDNEGGTVSLSPSAFAIDPCRDQTLVLTLANHTCGAVSLTKLQALDSGTSIVAVESLPHSLTLSDSLHLRVSALSTSSIIPIRLTFSGPSGVFTKFVYLTQGQSANAFPLTLATSVAISGSLCDNLIKSASITNHNCSTVQILSVELTGADSNQFKILNDLTKTTLVPGDSMTVLLSCVATSAGTYHTALDLRLSNGTITFDTTIQLRATISGGSLPVQLRMTDLESDTVGDTISVPVRIYGGNSRAMSGFALDMRYNTKLLNLLPPVIQNTNSALTSGQEVHHEGTGGLLTVEGPMLLNPTLPLVILRFATLPTDSLCTTLVLNSCSFTDTSQNTLCPPVASLDSVQICLTKSPSQSVAARSKKGPDEISTIVVNGHERMLSVTYSSATIPQFSLVDELGRNHELPERQRLGSNTMLLSLGTLPTGFYLLQMRTESASYSKGFIYTK